MGNEMGNNNTSSIKEEDNISEVHKKNLLEDSKHTNVTSQDVHADDVNEENQNILTSLTKDAMENSSNDINDISQEDDHADDVKEEIETIPITEAKDAKEQAELFASSNITSILENDSLEGVTHESEKNMEGTEECRKQEDSTHNHHLNDEPSIKYEEDNISETDKKNLLEDISEHANVITQDVHADVVKEKNHNIPTSLTKDAMEKYSKDFNDITIQLGKDTSQEDDHADDVKGEIQTIPTAEAKDAKEKAILFASSNTTSMFENDSLEGDTHESEMNLENQVHPTSEAEDVHEKAKGMASDHTIISLENELWKGKEDQEITARLSYDDDTTELEGKPQEDKQDGDIIIPIPLNLTKSFTGEGEEMNGARQSEKSSCAESFESENWESLSSSSMEGTDEECRKQEESCLRKNLSLSDNHDLNDESSIKQDEEETMLLTLNTMIQSNDSELQEPSVHHDELIKIKSQCEHSLQGFESVIRDTLLDANSHGVLSKDMESQEKLLCANKSYERDGNEFGKGQMTIGSIGNCNGEIQTVLDYSVFEIPKSDQIEELKVTENGLQIDVYVNKYNKASDESSAVPQQKHSVVPEYDTNENPEASYVMVEAFEETINQEEYFSLQNTTSLKQTNESGATLEKLDFSITVPYIDLVDEEAIERESEKHSQQAEETSLIVAELTTSAATISTEPCANSGYETRLSIESNSDNPIISCQIQKSPSFNLDLRIEARKLLYQDKSANESLSKQTGINISNAMLHNAEMPVEEKIVTMERSYSEISKAPFRSILKDEEEAHLLVAAQTQVNHGGTNKEVEEVSSTSLEGKEKRKSRSYFFSSCVCCETVTN